jgi:large subunit ribosomal protein L9
MEVILREHVDNVGRRGEIVKVADGYARNYLLPRKLALPVTPGNLNHIERERARFDAEEGVERQAAEAVASRLAGLEITITRKVGETDALYGSVTAADIVESLAAQKFELDKRKIQLHEPIRRLGEYDVPIKLHREVVTPIKVKVVAEGGPEKAPQGTKDSTND